MSTVKTALTEQQRAACNSAIEDYIIDSYEANNYDEGTVVLLPEFQPDAAGKWHPVVGSAIRKANNPNSPDAAFIRMGSLIAEGVDTKARYLNDFNDDAGKVVRALRLQKAGEGLRMKGKLVIEESLVPTSTTNPDRDIKQTPDGIRCVFTGERMNPDTAEVVTYNNAPIYRRTVYTTDESRKDIFIAHTNKEQISTAARARWNSTNSNAIKDAAAAKMSAK